MAVGIIVEESIDVPILHLIGVIGHVIAAVVKNDDGSITLERDIAVNVDSFEDNELVEHVIKDIEAALNSVFPDPNKPQPSKIWVP